MFFFVPRACFFGGPCCFVCTFFFALFGLCLPRRALFAHFVCLACLGILHPRGLTLGSLPSLRLVLSLQPPRRTAILESHPRLRCGMGGAWSSKTRHGTPQVLLVGVGSLRLVVVSSPSLTQDLDFLEHIFNIVYSVLRNIFLPSGTYGA